MNFQSKVFETTEDLRSRAAAFANAFVGNARARATQAAGRIEAMKGPLSALQVAGREFNQVARRHASRLVKENAAIARDAGKEVSALARATYSKLAKQPAAIKPRKARKTASSRKRATSKAA